MTPTFQTHNDREIDTDGTFLQGYIETTYADLSATFGSPEEYPDGKTDWEWEIEFADGTVATIYNWKNGPNYRSGNGYALTANRIKEWHVGGRRVGTEKAVTVAMVEKALGGQS